MVRTRKQKRHERASEVPVTVKQLGIAKAELKSDISAFQHQMNSRFKAVDSQFKQTDARFNEVDARFNQVDARFNEVDARFDRVDARFNRVDARFDKMDSRLEKMEEKLDQMLAKMHQMHLTNELQGSQNRIVMEGLTNIFHRQDQMEKKFIDFETLLIEFKRNDQNNF